MRPATRRRAVWIAGAVLGLLGAAALVASVDLGRYREQLEATLAERLGRDVTIGAMHVSLWPLGIRAEDSQIGEDPAFPTGQPFASAKEMYVSVSPLVLLRGRIELQSVELRSPAIELVRNADGVWNVASLRSGGGGRSSGQVLNRLVVTGGQVAVATVGANEMRRVVYQNIDVTLDQADDQPFRLAATARLPGDADRRITLRGEGGPIAGGRLEQAWFKGEVEFDAIVTGTAALVLTANEAVVDDLEVALGSTNARGRATIRNFIAPEIDFELSADTIDVMELQRLFTDPERTKPPPALEEPAPLFLRTTGAGRLQVGTIRYHELVLENAEADARLNRGVVTLRPLTASLFGGEHRGSIVVDASRLPIAVTADSNLEQVDANRLLSATTNLDDVVQGTLDSSNRLTFTADGADTVAPTLNGTLSLSIPEARIAHVDLMHAIRTLAGFAADDGDRQITTVRDLRARFTVSNGIAHAEDLTATIDDDSTIAGTGSIDLVNRALDLHLTAVLSREFSDRVGGRAVAGILSTVLANDSGELVVPMLVTGTTKEPRFAPDLKRIAEMKLGEKLPENPAAKVEDALRRIFGRGAKQPASSTP